MEVTTLLLILLATTIKDCYASANNSVHPLIYNGKDARPGQFPFMAVLIHPNRRLHSFCSGTLTSTKYVLTAAHCLQMETSLLYLGAHKLSDKNEKGRLEFLIPNGSWILHEKYNKKAFANDIALIRLPTQVQLTKTIQTINLAGSNIGSLVNKMATILGWGADRSGATSAVLQYGHGKISPDEECRRLFGGIYRSSNLCLSGKGQQACPGDSGGPAVVQDAKGAYTQVGLVSFSRNGDCPSSHVAYTRITFYLDWIRANTRK